MCIVKRTIGGVTDVFCARLSVTSMFSFCTTKKLPRSRTARHFIRIIISALYYCVRFVTLCSAIVPTLLITLLSYALLTVLIFLFFIYY